MLVLTRKKGEEILIGDDIVVTVIEVRGDSIRIGIEAPAGVVIHRREVLQAVTDANVEASKAADADAPTLAGLLAARAKPEAD